MVIIKRQSVLMWVAIAMTLSLGACSTAYTSTAPVRTTTPVVAAPSAVKQPEPAIIAVVTPTEKKRGGGFYMNDGPDDVPPPNIENTPDAVPKIEPILPSSVKPYVALGKEFKPETESKPFKQVGMASWYGKQFHGRKTATGEVYDMYGMTAAHPTLPLPSYAIVTNVANKKSVIVRLNDRGPFHGGRIIDLTYTAAAKLGFVASGTAKVEVEWITPEMIANAVPLSTTVPVVSSNSSPVIEPVAEQKPAKNKVPVAVAINNAATTSQVTVNTEDMDAHQQKIADVLRDAIIVYPASQIKGIYLQLGVFSTEENADRFRVETMLRGTSLADSMKLVYSNYYYRVVSGPYSSIDAAKESAKTLKLEMDLGSLVVNY